MYFSEIAVTALKYESPMFQKFIICLSDNYFLYGFMYMLYFFKINNFFFHASVSSHSYAKIWFQKQYHSY